MFIKSESGEKQWFPFKYENLPSFCFGCERMGHSLKECDFASEKVKQLSEDDFPYSTAIKAKSTILGSVNLKFGNKGKKLMS